MTTGRKTMTAIVQNAYGPAPEDVLRVEKIDRPAIGEDEILVRVHAASVDRGTWHVMAGLPYQAERRELAKARRPSMIRRPDATALAADFSELETRAGGTWQMTGVLDYVSNFCLTCPVTATKTWRDAAAALEAARERATEILGRPLIADLVDRDTGELSPVVVVTDHGPCYRLADEDAMALLDDVGRSPSTVSAGSRRPTTASSWIKQPAELSAGRPRAARDWPGVSGARDRRPTSAPWTGRCVARGHRRSSVGPDG